MSNSCHRQRAWRQFKCALNGYVYRTIGFILKLHCKFELKIQLTHVFVEPEELCLANATTELENNKTILSFTVDGTFIL